MFSVQPDDIRQAATRIQALARRTPVLRSRTLNALTGVEAHLKAENFQRGGAFKIRGATNFLYSMPEAERARGVVSYSSGNHAQAVAMAARSLAMRATLVMPTDSPRSKLEATRAQGATIVLYDRQRESREAIGKKISEESGATLVPPFDHPWIIAGQGTCALEFLEEVDGLEGLVVCLGGGGLLAGCAVMAKAIDPRIRIFGVEPEAGNDYWLSRRAGYRVEIAPPQTIADGLRTTKPGVETFPIIQSLVEDVLLVSDDEIVAAMRFLLSRMKILVEPSGAAGVAALLAGKLPAGIGRVGVILTGGNVDLEFLARLAEDKAGG
jgi:threonine dehydratase